MKYRTESTLFWMGTNEDGEDIYILPPEFNCESANCLNCGAQNWVECYMNEEEEVEFCDQCPIKKTIN